MAFFLKIQVCVTRGLVCLRMPYAIFDRTVSETLNKNQKKFIKDLFSKSVQVYTFQNKSIFSDLFCQINFVDNELNKHRIFKT